MISQKVLLRLTVPGYVFSFKYLMRSLKYVRAFVDQFNSMKLPLNILINNEEVMFCPFQLSEDGVEMQFATNHLGHFLLTSLLLDTMKATAKSTGIEGRTVNLSSVAHHHTYPKGIDFDKLNDEKIYNDKMAYGQSKLANLLHAKVCDKKLPCGVHRCKVNCHDGECPPCLVRVEQKCRCGSSGQMVECYKVSM